MTGIISVICGCLGLALMLSLAYGAIQSYREHESRAAGLLVLLALLAPLPFFLVGLLEFEGSMAAAVALLALLLAAVAVFLVPTKSKTDPENDTPTTRIDERDIMFSRKLLQVGSERFEHYYREHPDKRAADDLFRAEPGLLQKGSRNYSPYSFSAANSSFATVKQLHALVDGPIESDTVVTEPAAMTAFLKRWAIKLGARDVGITELHDYHKYTTVGRGEEFGRKVKLDHRFAIALTVEMDKEMIDRAPFGPIVMESAQQYLAAGAIAIQLAECVRALGYPARAHIDGNYRVVCPLVARDAGLGEIGRMGLLMTTDLGPRVRLAVVTTDLPLVTDQRRRDHSMIEFCIECKKCAEACPSRAISFEDRRPIDGVRRWQINQEVCYTLWSMVGTDCGRCVKVCPYSHPDNLLHKTVRWGVRNSALFRKAAVKLDDVFYGRVPPPRALQDWLELEPNNHAAVDRNS